MTALRWDRVGKERKASVEKRHGAEERRQSEMSTFVKLHGLQCFVCKRDGDEVRHSLQFFDKTGEAEGKMILQFRQTDFELLGWRQVDGTGAETRVQLSGIKKNVSLKPSLFVVEDPSDAGDDRR